MNSNLKGNIGEAKALSYFISNGYEVYIPFGTATKCDLIVLKDNVSYRVSEKTTSSIDKNGSYNVRIKQGKLNEQKPFNKEESDFLFIYIIPEDRCILLKSKEVKQLFQISIKK